MSNDSIFFVVNKDGMELWFTVKPKRYKNEYWRINHMNNEEDSDRLFPGAIKAITGSTLTWEDEPLEWKPGHDNVLLGDAVKRFGDAIDKKTKHIEFLEDQLRRKMDHIDYLNEKLKK